MNLMVLETSTSSSKFIIYDTESNKMTYQTSYFNFDLNENDSVDKVLEHLFQLIKNEFSAQKIDAILISSTWHNLLVCDEHMTPISRPYYWNDNVAINTIEQLKKLTDFENVFYQKTGCIVHPQYPFFKYQAIKGSFESKQIIRISDVGSYLYYLLTNNYATSLAMMSGSGFINLREGLYDEELLKMVNLNQENLPEILDDKKSYPLSSFGKNLLGIDQDIPVYLPYPDGYLNQIGETYFADNEMSFSIGTSAAMRVFNPVALLSKSRNTWCYKVGEEYLIGGATSGASNHLVWAKNTLLPNENLEEVLTWYDPTKNYPVFLPFMYGERSPGWNYSRTSGFDYLNEYTTSSDMFFGVMEGIVFNAFQTYQALENVVGKTKMIRLSGGFVNSKIAQNLCVNVFNTQLVISEMTQQSLWGGVKRLLYLSEMPVPTFNFDERVINPNQLLVSKYKEKYDRYLECYHKGDRK